MFTLENILIFIFITLLVVKFQTIFTAVILYFLDIKKPIITMMSRDELSESTQEIIKPYEEVLLKLGFEYQTQINSTFMVTRYDLLQESIYYYHPVQAVHAIIDTTPMAGCLRSATISFVTFYESQNMALTYDCFIHNIIALPSNIYTFDHYYGSFKEAYTQHLKEREIEGEKALRGVLSQEGLYNYTEYLSDEMLEISLEKNIIRSTEEGYKFSLSLPFLSYINNSIKGIKKARQSLKKYLQTKEVSPQKQTLFYSSEQKALEQRLEEKPKESTKSNKIKLFIFSAITFAILFGLVGIPWTVLPIIMTVLIIHELGHFWAMKYFGYKDTSIFFIPLFGAAAKGEKEETTPFEEYIVYLAGPLPGIIISITIGILMFSNPELRSNGLLKDYALMSLVLNYINLLPIFPLDGGKIVQTLLFTRYPKAQFYFFLLSLLVIILVALMLESIFLGFFAVILFLSINHHYRISQLIESIMKQQNDAPFKQRVIEMLTTQKPYIDEPLNTKVSMAKQALKILNAQKPSTLLMVLGLGFYALLVLAPLILKIGVGFL